VAISSSRIGRKTAQELARSCRIAEGSSSRLLHRHEREHLQEMVLAHVAKRTDAVVEAPRFSTPIVSSSEMSMRSIAPRSHAVSNRCW